MLVLCCSPLVRRDSPGDQVPNLGTSWLPLLEPRRRGGGGGGGAEAPLPPRDEKDAEREELIAPSEGRGGG